MFAFHQRHRIVIAMLAFSLSVASSAAMAYDDTPNDPGRKSLGCGCDHGH